MDFVAPDLNFVASACILVPTWLEARDGPMAREMAPSPLKKLDRVAGLSRDDAYPAQSVPRMVSRVQLAPAPSAAKSTLNTAPTPSVPIALRLERSVLRHAEILRLLRRHLGQLHADLGQM